MKSYTVFLVHDISGLNCTGCTLVAPGTRSKQSNFSLEGASAQLLSDGTLEYQGNEQFLVSHKAHSCKIDLLALDGLDILIKACLALSLSIK